ncbi:MAG: Alkaline phosphatase synthesis sensor protein PhoR [Candidatus Omnitrophica bacterium ADurb.Bin205]|nr:MAG: Alkaline phosphatase synthesis sensor protein PhoR [Candidatus Omnitrophica bacterium ADurb.Bin205]
MRAKTIKFKICILYASVLGVVLSIYVGLLFFMPADLLQKNKLFYILIPIPLTLLFGYYIGRLIIMRILKPIKKMTDTVKNITHEDLSLRVKAENVDEELGRLIEAFNDMVSRLGESFEYITDSSSYIAHELKTPIAIIRGESEFALKKERDKEEYKRVISVSLEETKRMLKIIEDLLLLTKMNYQPDVLKFERIDLTQFIRIIYEQAKILSSQKKITVNADIPEEAGMVSADELHLRRLFLNLIDNAIKFTPDNGSIGITLKYENQKAIVSIVDTGIGIEEENMPKLFEKFFRIEGKTKDNSPSSGLGLSIAQSIAELHGGEISVTSRAGQGSNFSVSIPLLN